MTGEDGESFGGLMTRVFVVFVDDLPYLFARV